MKLWSHLACWIVLLFFVCSASLLSKPVPDIADKRKPDARCWYVGSAVDGLNQWSIHGQNFERVFTGTIRSVENLSNGEKRLDLVPDEVFFGDETEVTVTIRDACLAAEKPELKAGDKWLFFLRPKPYVVEITRQIRTKGLEVPWFSESAPVADAEADIATLRRLRELTDKGILTGSVIRVGPIFDNLNPRPVLNHKVIAKNLSTGIEYAAFTNDKGRFEFELPRGRYEVNASTKQGMRDANPFTEIPQMLEYGLGGNAVVRKQDWTVINDFMLVPDGRLAGRVTAADGGPARFAKIAIIPIAPVRAQLIVYADENGHFESMDDKQGSISLV